MKRLNLTINFDMDGTIANLYGDPAWLEKIKAKDEGAYADATPLLPLNLLARYIHKMQGIGIKVGIISWLAKGNDDEYAEQVTQAKLEWLEQHLPTVKFDFIDIIPYGTPKEQLANTKDDILFDDEELNRNNWTGRAYAEKDILRVLKAIAKNLC